MGGYREDECVEEEPLPTMDWAALERHLAGLQCREQENQNLNQNHNHNMGKTNYTSVSVNGFDFCIALHVSVFICFVLKIFFLWLSVVVSQFFLLLSCSGGHL